MVRLVGGVLVLLLVLPALADDKDKPKDKADTPAEQYKALVKEYADAMKAFQDAYTAAKTDEEREKVFEEKYPKPAKLAPKFLELAEKNPKDPVAFDALAWIATNGSRGPQGKDDPRSKAIDIIIRDHVQSDKLGQVIQTMSYSPEKENGQFLRAVMEKNSSKEMQGLACLAIGQHLKNRRMYAEMLKNRPEVAKQIEAQLGTDAAKELKELDPKQYDKEIEQTFEQAAEKYPDVKLPNQGTVGAKAKSELFEIRNLAVGMRAPDVEGEDQDGKKFKLSDYKGKVVLLDFWSQY